MHGLTYFPDYDPENLECGKQDGLVLMLQALPKLTSLSVSH